MSATKSPPLTERDVRAAGEYLATHQLAPGMYNVYSEDGTEYTVDTESGACTCGDYRYRTPSGGCKHVRRVRMERGELRVPSGVRVDPLLSDQLEDES